MQRPRKVRSLHHIHCALLLRDLATFQPICFCLRFFVLKLTSFLDQAQQKPSFQTIYKDNPSLANKLTKHWEKTHTCAPVQLLTTLLTVLEDEVVELTFDHIDLHQSCLALFNNINITLHEEIVADRDPNYLNAGWNTATVVNYILADATKTKKVPASVTDDIFKKTGQRIWKVTTHVDDISRDGRGSILATPSRREDMLVRSGPELALITTRKGVSDRGLKTLRLGWDIHVDMGWLEHGELVEVTVEAEDVAVYGMD